MGLLLALVLAAPSGAELNDRFARGVRLFDEGRVADALLEFEALESLKPNPVVRFNLAHCHAKLGHPVRAVALLEGLTREKKLTPERLVTAQTLLVEQRARIATLELHADARELEGVLEIDGASSRATLPTTMQVDPGAHNVTFQATGFFPARQVAVAAPGASTKVSLTLLRAERPPARVRVSCLVPAVELRIDGALVATTPLSTALLVSPGAHTLEATRAGYAPFTRALALSENVEEVVDVALVPQGEGAVTLRVAPSEPQAVVTVDGALVRADVPTRLPPGLHRVRVEREGFFPMQQEVVLADELTLPVVLEPTSETLVMLAQGRTRHRFWGFLGVGVGGAAVVAGALVWGLNQARLTELQANVARLKGLCVPVAGMPSGVCPAAEYSTQSVYLTEAESVRNAGLITGGLGLVVVGAGLLSLFTSPDLSRYEARETSGPLAPLTLSVGPGSVGLSGRF